MDGFQGKKRELTFRQVSNLENVHLLCSKEVNGNLFNQAESQLFFFFIVYVLFALELHLGRAQVLQRKGPIKVHQGKRTQIRQQLPVVVIRLARVPPPPVRVLPEHVLQRDRCSLGFANALPLVLGGRPIGL